MVRTLIDFLKLVQLSLHNHHSNTFASVYLKKQLCYFPSTKANLCKTMRKGLQAAPLVSRQLLSKPLWIVCVWTATNLMNFKVPIQKYQMSFFKLLFLKKNLSLSLKCFYYSCSDPSKVKCSKKWWSWKRFIMKQFWDRNSIHWIHKAVRILTLLIQLSYRMNLLLETNFFLTS